MKLQDIYRMAENWRNADNERYSVEFYSKVIADLIDWDLLQNSGFYDWSANIGSVVWEYQIINDSGLYWAQFSTRDLQPKLVSGTNIKTINNQSLLGSGNLTPSNIGAITRFVVDLIKNIK